VVLTLLACAAFSAVPLPAERIAATPAARLDNVANTAVSSVPATCLLRNPYLWHAAQHQPAALPVHTHSPFTASSSVPGTCPIPNPYHGSTGLPRSQALSQPRGHLQRRTTIPSQQRRRRLTGYGLQ